MAERGYGERMRKEWVRAVGRELRYVLVCSVSGAAALTALLHEAGLV